jgi:acyl carrier protein
MDAGGIEAKIRGIVANHLEIDPSTIVATTRFVDDLRVDSLMVAEMMLVLEQEFNIVIPDRDLFKMKTIGDVTEYIYRHPLAATAS